MYRLLLALLVTSCTSSSPGTPTPTGAECPSPDPMTFGYTLATTPGCTGTPDQCNFGKTFMDSYCINCHAAALTQSKRNGAPLYHDLDTLEGVLRFPEHVDEQAGIGPLATNRFMPGAGTDGKCPSVAGGSLDEKCPKPSDQERMDLAVWLACEKARPHMF